jgi:hypothetical protein
LVAASAGDPVGFGREFVAEFFGEFRGKGVRGRLEAIGCLDESSVGPLFDLLGLVGLGGQLSDFV